MSGAATKVRPEINAHIGFETPRKADLGGQKSTLESGIFRGGPRRNPGETPAKPRRSHSPWAQDRGPAGVTWAETIENLRKINVPAWFHGEHMVPIKNLENP